MRLRLLARATRDMRAIFDFIEEDSPEAARDVARRLIKSLQIVAQNPSIGRPSKTKSVREWAIPGIPYVVPFRIRGDRVEVLRVWHTSRDRPKSWT